MQSALQRVKTLSLYFIQLNPHTNTLEGDLFTFLQMKRPRPNSHVGREVGFDPRSKGWGPFPALNDLGVSICGTLRTSWARLSCAGGGQGKRVYALLSNSSQSIRGGQTCMWNIWEMVQDSS